MEQHIEFTNLSGEKLSGTLHQPDHPSGCGVILGHCFTCSRNTRILIRISQGLAENGISALRFDFSGNGKSEGRFIESSYSKHVAEMEAAAGFLRSSGVFSIGLAGHSMGAAIALIAGSRMDEVNAVCTLAGRLTGLNPLKILTPAQRTQLSDTGSVFFNSRGRALELGQSFFSDAANHDLPDLIRHYRRPLLVVHGDRDEIIPLEDGFRQRDLDACGAEQAVIPGADHMFSREDHREDVADRVVAWFKTHL